MPPRTKQQFRRHIAPMAAVSVIAWVAFASFYRVFWHGPSAPGDDLGLFALWLSVGAAAFVGALFVAYRLFKTPPQWRASAALALTAPALLCDVLTIFFFEAWFPHGGGANDRIYAAFIVGGVGLVQMVSLYATDPESTA